jgi:hypothetical protein
MLKSVRNALEVPQLPEPTKDPEEDEEAMVEVVPGPEGASDSEGGED